MKGKYLSEIIDLEDLGTYCLNLIEAPCGAGKTEFVKKILEPFINTDDWQDILFLIDTKIGAEQLELTFKDTNITVMTYARYANIVKNTPKEDHWNSYDSVIVCDEFHNLIQWSKWQDNNIHRLAFDIIFTKIYLQKVYMVIALSATPQKIRDAFEPFKEVINEVPLLAEPRQYENKNISYYDNLTMLLNEIQPHQKGIIYIPHISQIIKYQNKLMQRGIKAASIWSIRNIEYPMTEEQQELRQYIVQNRSMPLGVDVLFINKSCETSITINGHIDFMIVHSSEEDVQIQARGRYRNDLEQLYLYNIYESSQQLSLSEGWLERPLYKKDKIKLCEELDIKNECGRVLGWTSVKSILVDMGYTIEDKKIKGGSRYVIISK